MTHLQTYAEWIGALEKFRTGDDTIIVELERGTFNLDAGVASRFYTQVEGAYKDRKERWVQHFNRSLSAVHRKDIAGFSILMQAAKSNLFPLVRFANAAGLPLDLRKALAADLEAFVADVKASLMSHAAKGQHKEIEILIIRDLVLPAKQAASIPKQLPDASGGTLQQTSPNRQILF